MIDKVRQIALKILYNVDKNGAFSNIELDKTLNNIRNEEKNNKSEKINGRDIGFISEIVYGTISWKMTIDEIIKKYSNIKIKKISTWIINILRMSVYQIVFLDKVPKSAVVNEAVELSKRYGHKGSASFVNAILRKIDKKDFKDFFEIENDIERIAKTTSMPMWIVENLLKQKEKSEVEEICRCSNIRPKLYIRINKLKTDKLSLVQRLQNEGVKVEEIKNIKNSEANSNTDFLEVKEIRNLESLNSFKEGLFTVQDLQAGKIPIILNPRPNEKILDACSSPGGKTTYIAELMENKGEIVAWDIYEHRIELVNKVAKRLGIDIIKTEVRDATIYEEKYLEYFDKILLDVPCLGLGVVKRKPDIKWQKKPEDIEEITKIQEKILQNCSKFLKNNGILVYSTCSILKDENEEIVSKFVEKNKKFKIMEMHSTYQNEENDGFFICKMLKI